jgi:hypothetical protein
MGLLHYEFIPRGQIFNEQFNLEVLKRLMEAERWKNFEGLGKPDLDAEPRHHDATTP